MSREIAKPEEHLSDDSILRLIDGEADPSRVSQIRSHLEACWSCRAREEWLREAIGRFVFYREAVYSPAAQPPPRNWAGFSAKLQQQTEQMETRVTDRLWANLRRFRRFLVPAWAGHNLAIPVMAALLLAVGLVWILHFSQAPAPSSATLLRRSVAAEESRLTSPQALVHRTVTLEERQPGSGDLVAVRKIDIWQSADKKIARRVYGEDGRLVAGEWLRPGGSHLVYQNAQLRPASSVTSNPLAKDQVWHLVPSARGFAGLAHNPQQVTVEERPAVYVLHYENGQGNAPKLLRASLTLRRSDLHPVEQTLLIEHGGQIRDYRFVETGFEQHAASEVVADAFSVDPGLVRPEHHHLFAVPSGSTAVLSASANELAESELKAWLALHATGADKGEAVEIARSQPGKIEVTGLVSSDQQKKELLTSLRAIPHVKASIQTTEEVAAAPVPESSGTVRLKVEMVTPIAPPLETALRERFPRYEDRHEFENQVISAAQQAMQEAGALRKLAERYTPEELDLLSDSSRQRLAALIQDHVSALRQQIQSVHALMKPMLPPGAAHLTPSSAADWRQTISVLVPQVQAVRENVAVSLSGSGGGSADAALLCSRLQDALTQSTTLLSHLSMQVTGQFLQTKDR